MNGWPATAASTLRSLRTCSTCFRRMTSTFRSTLSANTWLLSEPLRPANLVSQTRANVPVPNVFINSKSSLRRSFDEWPTRFCWGSIIISETSIGFVSACHSASFAFSSSRAEKVSRLSFPSELLWLMRCRREVILSTIPGAMIALIWAFRGVVCYRRKGTARAVEEWSVCGLKRSSLLHFSGPSEDKSNSPRAPVVCTGLLDRTIQCTGSVV